MKITNRQKGFSLLEVMVAMGIMAGAGVGIMRLMNNQMKTSKTVETRFEYSSILNDIREILGDRKSCAANFAGRPVDAVPEGTVTFIRQVLTQNGVDTNNDKYQSNTNFALAQNFGNGAVKILGYRISSTDMDASVGVPPAGSEGSTNLLIRFAVAAGGANTTGVKESVRKIKLNVTVDPITRAIQTCSSTGAMADYEARYVNVTGDTMTGTLFMGDASTPLIPAHIVMMNNNEIDFQSDKRLKHEIKDIKTLSKIRQLHPVHYKWKKTGTTAYGVIAQELALVYPELVHKRVDDYLTVNYIQLTPIMLRGIQEVDDENQKLKKEISDLKEVLKLMRQDICKTNPKASSCK